MVAVGDEIGEVIVGEIIVGIGVGKISGWASKRFRTVQSILL